jgi:competence protein ComER
MRIGIIGCGRMGGMLATALSRAGADLEVAIFTRTIARALALQRDEAIQVYVCDTLDCLLDRADLVLLCTHAEQVQELLPAIAARGTDRMMLGITCSSVALTDLERQIPGPVFKCIPSVTQWVLGGAMLFIPGPRMTACGLACPEPLSRIARAVTVRESEVRVYSDLVSCFPAFLAAWLQGAEQAAIRRGVPAPVAAALIAETVTGTGRLLSERSLTLAQIIERVAVPGGVTEVGLREIADGDPTLFERVFTATAHHRRP